MKINKNDLKKALEIVKPGLATNESIEQSTFFCFMKNKVITYNDEISVSAPVKGLDIEGAINADEMYGFISKIKAEEIDLDITEKEVHMKSGRSKVGLTLYSEIKLPLDEIGKKYSWKKLPDDFLIGIKFAMSSCSKDMSNPKLTCVHVNEKILEGTDNFRLVNYTLSKKVPINSFLIPAMTCVKLVSMEPIEIAEGEGWVHFRTSEKAVISCRIFEDKYPNTSALLSVKGKNLTFPKSINTILEKASVFAKRESSLDESITVILDSNKITIKSASASGWFEEKTKTKYEGKKIEFLITPYLLKDILKETMTAVLGKGRLMFSKENWKYITLLRG